MTTSQDVRNVSHPFLNLSQDGPHFLLERSVHIVRRLSFPIRLKNFRVVTHVAQNRKIRKALLNDASVLLRGDLVANNHHIPEVQILSQLPDLPSRIDGPLPGFDDDDERVHVTGASPSKMFQPGLHVDDDRFFPLNDQMTD